METVKIVNLKQVSKYIENGIQPIKIEVTDRLVFIFNREETREIFKKWCNYQA